MNTYAWADHAGTSGFRHLDPQEIGQHIEKLGTDGEGVSTAELFDDAQDKSSPLHAVIEWNGKKAVRELGMIRLRNVAGGLRLRVVIVDKDENEKEMSLPMNISLSDPAENAGPGARRYFPIQSIQSDPSLKDEAIKRIRSDIASLRVKLDNLELLESDMIDSLTIVQLDTHLELLETA